MVADLQRMKKIDLNADLGEGMTTDLELIKLISSANIACGYHAGNNDTIRQTIDHCIAYNVAIGAHPSFPDPENFGRLEMHLPENELNDIIQDQLQIITAICAEKGIELHHVKPHGALYNMCTRNEDIAAQVARAVMQFNKNLIYVGLADSIMLEQAEAIGLKTVAEFFADRRYDENKILISRRHPMAVIESVSDVLEQVKIIVLHGKIKAVSGQYISMSNVYRAATICLHGDGANALMFAHAINKLMSDLDITVQSF